MNNRRTGKILIAANPKSGAVSALERVTALNAALVARGLDSEVITSLERLQAQALLLNRSGELRTVVAAGGDGTVAALANLLPAEVPLVIFPQGTENLLAKHWGFSRDVEATCATIESGHEVAMDVGSANGKLFLVMLSCGYDAEVVRIMHSVRRGHIKRWSYALPIARALGIYRFPQLTAQLDPNEQFAEQPSAAWVFIFNVPRYAANLQFCPQADPCDGRLDVCTFRRSGILAGLYYLTRLWLGSHQKMAGFERRLAQEITIPAPLDRNGRPYNIPFQVDGDPGGVLPLRIETLPQRLRLLVPQTISTN